MSLPQNLKQSIGKCNPNHIAILKYGFQNHFLDNTDDKQAVSSFLFIIYDKFFIEYRSLCHYFINLYIFLFLMFRFLFSTSNAEANRLHPLKILIATVIIVLVVPLVRQIPNLKILSVKSARYAAEFYPRWLPTTYT